MRPARAIISNLEVSMILIVGVTGVLGREVAAQLMRAGKKVRGLTRDPARAADLQQSGVEIVQGDLVVKASLERACAGVDAVLASAHQLMGTGRYSSEAVDDVGHHDLIDAALAAGVKRFVYVSAQGAGPDHPVDFYRTKAKVEEYLKKSGMTHVILRPPAFMEWHVHNLLGKGILDSGKALIYGSGRNPANFMAARDVAHIAVLALTDPRIRNRTLEIGGPDNISRNRIAELYAFYSGIRPRISHVPTGMMRVMAPMMRAIQPVPSRLMKFSVWVDTTDQTFCPEAMLEEFPMELTHVEEFIQERAAPR